MSQLFIKLHISKKDVVKYIKITDLYGILHTKGAIQTELLYTAQQHLCSITWTKPERGKMLNDSQMKIHSPTNYIVTNIMM